MTEEGTRVPTWDAERIRALRMRLGYSQEEMARLCGVTYSALQKWELGVARPRPSKQEILASLEAGKISEDGLPGLRKKVTDLGLLSSELAMCLHCLSEKHQRVILDTIVRAHATGSL